MPPLPSTTSLSPAELSFLRSCLSQNPPIRLDATKGPRDFRAMRAETDVLPSANGSARIALEDGTEALVGVKAEVHASSPSTANLSIPDSTNDPAQPHPIALDLTVEIPGHRDDDPLPTFLAATLKDSLFAVSSLGSRLRINNRFHWALHIDILLLSPPLSYPLSLLSMATHLALLSTRLPALKSQGDEDPLFDDDWEAAVPLFSSSSTGERPPVVLLAMAVAENVVLDPSREELAVADAVLAVACTTTASGLEESGARIVGIRTVDPPSHLSGPGVPNSLNSATGGTAPANAAEAATQRELLGGEGAWVPPRGGMKRGLVSKVVKMIVEKGGAAEEVLKALAAVEGG